MKQFKLVDSLNSKEQVRHNEAKNWYCRQLEKKNALDRVLEKEYDKGVPINQEKCQVR